MAALDRRFWVCAAVFLVLFLACFLALDLRLKMWNDELFTLYVAQQGSARGIISAIEQGMDGTPPLYPILVSRLLGRVGPDELAVRLPATIGFTAMLLCILVFCRRRMPAACGFIAAFLAALACGFYATEGRAYGLVLGCAAGALLAWQATGKGDRRVGWLLMLACSLMLATALHYYSIFLLLPLGVAELVRWRERDRPDFAIALALAPSLAVLALHAPLIIAGKRYLAHFWVPGLATWSQIPAFYVEYGLLSLGVMLIGVILLALRSGPEPIRQPELPGSEWVAAAGMALMPAVIVPLSLFTTHVFLSRYALWAVVGLAITAAGVSCAAAVTRPLISMVIFLALLGMMVSGEATALRQQPELRQGEAIRRALQSVPDNGEPIVIGYSHAFVELSYYAEPGSRDRLYLPISRSLELQYTSSDLDYQLLSGLAKRTNLHIVELDAFVTANPKFLLAASPKDHLRDCLIAEGFHLVPIGTGGLYEVSAPGKP